MKELVATLSLLMIQGQVDETYIKVNGEWKYLYRAVDRESNTLDFMLSARRNKKAAIAIFQESSQS